MSDDQTPVDPDDQHDPVQPIALQDEMENSFLEYAMSVIMSRALPDVRDGLKPVHRRIIWDMEQQGFRPCLLYTSPSPRDLSTSRMPSSA